MKLLIPVSLAVYDCIIIKGQGRKKPRQFNSVHQLHDLMKQNKYGIQRHPQFYIMQRTTLCDFCYVTFILGHMTHSRRMNLHPSSVILGFTLDVIQAQCWAQSPPPPGVDFHLFILHHLTFGFTAAAFTPKTHKKSLMWTPLNDT